MKDRRLVTTAGDLLAVIFVICVIVILLAATFALVRHLVF